MAFNVNELNVIRSYIAVTGAAPTQDQLAAAFNFSSLNALTRELTQGNTQTNAAFVESLYTNLLGRDADAEGLEYWTSLMSTSQGLSALSKAAVTAAFQFVAAENAANEAGLVDGTAGLSPVGGAFPTGGDDEEPGEGEPGTEYQDTFVFDTEVGRSDVSGWSHVSGDNTEAPVGAGATAHADRADYESKTHKIFNIGKEAIDKGINTISADYTFKVSNQLGDQGKYEGYFLSPILDNTTTNLGAVLTLEIIDRMAEANNKADALSLVAIESFSFYLNGEQQVISSQAILNATTYEELRDAIAAQLQAQGLTNVSVALGADFTRQQVDADTLVTTGANVLGTQIVLTAAGNSVIERGGFAFGERAGVDRNVDPSGRQDTSALGSTSSLISTNIELQNVGYGSQGGSINIAGQSNSNMGVEQFDVKANAHGNSGLGVWLTELSSNPLKDATQNALKVVNVTGGAKYFHIGEEQAAALRNNDGAVAAGKANAGLTDVRLFNAAQFAGNVKVNAEITENVIARDLNLVDTAGNPAADNVTYTYNTGSGNDQLILSVSQTLIAHEDASLSISTGSGNDYVHLVLDNDAPADVPSNWLANQQALNNISVNGGNGNNTIWTEGAGNAAITTGSGSDTIYTDNSGEKATWVYNNQSGIDANNPEDLLGFANPVIGFMPKATLTVAFSGASANGAGGVTDGAAVAGANGFEVTVDVPTTTGLVVTRAHLNQAVKKAINEDAVLSKLLVAKDGPNNTLIIESKIDGEFSADDLVITVATSAADFALLAASEQTAIANAYKAFTKDSDSDLAGAQAANNTNIATATAIDPALGVQAGGTPAIPGNGATASFAHGGFTFGANTTVEVEIGGAVAIAAQEFADAAALAAAIEALANVASATVVGGDIDIEFEPTANGAANPAIAVDVTNDIDTTDPLSIDVVENDAGTAGTAGTPATGLPMAGTDSDANSNNVINAGAGSDVIVLGTEDASNDTIVFSGNFGKNTIVNFEDDAVATGTDLLDFTSYLTNMIRTSASNSSASQERIATDVTGGALGANEVATLTFTFDPTETAKTFEALTGTQLLAALNGGATYGTIDGTLDSNNAAAQFGTGDGQIVGSTLNHLVFVENAANQGEYKVFHLTSVSDAGANVATGDFASATLVGTVDFGASVNFTADILV